MTQLEIVNHHLATHGRITPLEAHSNYRIWRLAAVIHKLKQRGLDIHSTLKVAPSGNRYAVYSLVG